VAAYRARGLRADYIHSREDASANARILKKLENHELDAIVQVRKLGEGFDHPYLSVAAVFSVFRELSPFVQFVGRIMRTIDSNNPSSPQNDGVVVFHAGANVARRWRDFQAFSGADQDYFDQLLPIEGLDFSTSSEIEISPRRREPRFEVSAQGDVSVAEIPLMLRDDQARRAIELLLERGVTADDYREAAERLQPVPTTKLKEKQAKGASIDPRVKTEAARILQERGINPGGSQLDTKRLGDTNLIVVKKAIDREIFTFLGRGPGERKDLTRDEIDRAIANFTDLVRKAEAEVFPNG
jgi:superfamily II DNA/RNA helicase